MGEDRKGGWHAGRERTLKRDFTPDEQSYCNREKDSIACPEPVRSASNVSHCDALDERNERTKDDLVACD
jgi:hypothetical protein